MINTVEGVSARVHSRGAAGHVNGKHFPIPSLGLPQAVIWAERGAATERRAGKVDWEEVEKQREQRIPNSNNATLHGHKGRGPRGGGSGFGLQTGRAQLGRNKSPDSAFGRTRWVLNLGAFGTYGLFCQRNGKQNIKNTSLRMGSIVVKVFFSQLFPSLVYLITSLFSHSGLFSPQWVLCSLPAGEI